jgi:ferredoxin
MTNLNFTIAKDKCIRCDACVNDCPTHIISRSGSVPSIMPEAEEHCLRCQHCLAVCPNGAISIFGLKPEDSLPLAADVLPTREQMKTLVRGRRSVRKFRHENVPRELIDALLADLAHAPTGCNDCDLVFTVVDDRRELERLLEQIVLLIENTPSINDPGFINFAVESYRQDKTDIFFRGAPHLLIVSPGTKAHCGQEDSVIALTYFELLAQTAGLGTTWCGMLKLAADAVQGIRELFGLEANTYFYAMMFGLPDVSYARTVQRENAAVIRTIKTQ